MPPQIYRLKSKPPVSQTVTVFEERVIKDVTNGKMKPLASVLIQSDWCLARRGSLSAERYQGSLHAVERPMAVSTQQKAAVCYHAERFQKKQPCQHLCLGLLATRSVKTLISVV